MNRRTLLTISTFACLCGGCALYMAIVSPFVSPAAELLSENRISSEEFRQGTPENRRQAEKFLPNEPWAATAKYQVAIHAGLTYVFADVWQKLDPGTPENPGKTARVRFQPFAMIWRSAGDDPNSQPVTIVSESAIVEFAKDFEMSKIDPGRVIGGALEGVVRIRGADGLSVDGRDFNFSESSLRVWSDNAVQFAFKKNTGSGQGLELDLIPESGTPSKDKPAIAGVRTVRLRKDVVMDLSGEPRNDGKPVETVHVTSAGRFEFGVDSHVASFHDDVRVVHPTGKEQFDRLNSQILTLIFEPERPQGDAAAAAPEVAADAHEKDSGFGGNVKLEFRRMRAEGPNTTVVSQRSELQARMQELTYDAEARVIALRDAKNVRLLQKDNELTCPEVTAVLDEAGQLEQAICRGAGKLFRYARDDADAAQGRRKRNVEMAAEWLKELQMRPDPESQLDLIELTGRAVLSQTRRMALQADVIRLWLTPQEKGKTGARRFDAPEGNSAEEQPRPRRLLALGEAAFASPKITGETGRLEVWFDEGPLPSAPQAPPEDRTSRRQALRLPTLAPGVHGASVPRIRLVQHTPSAGQRRHDSRNTRAASGRGLAAVASEKAPPEPRRRQAAPAKGRESPPASPPKEAPRDPAENPAHVVADRIRVRAMMDGDDTDVAEVITEGRVHVTQKRREGEPPFDLKGDHLHLRNYSEVHQVIDVTGRPAHIRDRGLQVEGAKIHFDRGANLAHVDGAGVLRLPVKRGFDGKPLPDSQLLDIFWQERMRFDGETARFFAGVRTQMSGSEIRCEEMHVALDQRISFTEERDDQNGLEPKVRSVLCRDGVELKSNEYVEDRLVQRRVARGFEFTFDQEKNSIAAQGPGTLEFWRSGGAMRPGLARSTGARANKPLQADSTEWEYTRVDFAGHMDGNVERRSTTFHDDVRVVYGPVPTSTDTIDLYVELLPLYAGRMKCEELHLVQHPGEENKGGNIALAARTNAELEGRTEHGLFHGKAARLSFDQAKDLFILFGDGRRDATIWRESQIGSGRSSVEAQRMDFIPSQNEVKVDRASGAQGSG